MAIKVVVVDSAQLPADTDFPPLETHKYGWEQYPGLSYEDVPERCWRADIVVALATSITRENLEKMPRLKLLITAGEACQRLDEQAAQDQGVELLAFPDARLDSLVEAQDLCNRISEAINHYIRNFENNGVPL